MKLILVLLLLISTCSFAQNQEGTTVYFVEDHDSFPDCKTIYYANGDYYVSQQEPVEIDLPNTIPVQPSSLSSNGLINFRSFGLEAEKFGSIELDVNQIIPYSRDDVIDLILATTDSSRFEWLMYDEEYLWDNYQILYDAKPPPKSVKADTIIDPIASQSTLRLPINVTSGIIDGVYIDERKFIRIERQGNQHLTLDYINHSRKIRKQSIQPLLDSLFQPFYFSNYEVTSGEYREFINWVADSIELRMAYDNLDHEDAMLLIDCTKKERDMLIPIIRKTENRERYGLTRKNRKKIDDSDWLKATKDFYYEQPLRYYKRRQRNAELLIYKNEKGKETPIYPDTTGFLSLNKLRVYDAFICAMAWHPAFDDYPVVNVNNEQIMAYCHWKQRQLNEEFKSKGYKITLRPPTITEYEFALKTTLGEEGFNGAIDQPNSNYSTFERQYYGMENLFLQGVDYSPFTKNNFSPGGPTSLDYKEWYRANQSNSSVKFLNGNVSEFVLDEVTPEKWQHYKLNSTEPLSNAHFVLGSNYIQGIKTLGDDQYNAIFHKTALKNGTSSPLVGFRLVYIIEKLE